MNYFESTYLLNRPSKLIFIDNNINKYNDTNSLTIELQRQRQELLAQ